MVNAGVYLLARFYPAFAPVPGWSTAVIVIGVASAFAAGLMALVSRDIKRVLAYSTISQLGYMVYAIGTGSIFAGMFQLLSHAIFKALLFLGAGAVITAVGTRDLGRMGGLGKKMPFVRVVFIIGALGLVGLPIANGFFSKELLLEEGLTHGPLWAYVIMLLGAGLTALYTLRLVWLVFYGKPNGSEPEHDGLPAMRIALGVLAFATLTSWLLAGGFSRLLAATLPFHAIEVQGTLEIVRQVLLSPFTWITLGVIAVGFFAWIRRDLLARPARVLTPPLREGLGFDWLNRQVARLVDKTAALLQRTQTGQLNWNILGILAGLVILLLVLVRGN
jgi:NADH-quinone oxidoreductase subunit L